MRGSGGGWDWDWEWGSNVRGSKWDVMNRGQSSVRDTRAIGESGGHWNKEEKGGKRQYYHTTQVSDPTLLVWPFSLNV